MKKFYLLAMLAIVVTIFSACQKDELIDEQLQSVALGEEKPDVYVENGYLAFKNLNTVDSVMTVLNAMTRDEREAWDARMGFKSAYADFERLFDEYEKLGSQEEFLAFKKKYQNRLTFNDADPTDNSIDYPFISTAFTPVLNQDGMMKIGKSVYQYTKTNRISVYDGDLNKLANLDQYINDDMVDITTNLKSTGSQTTLLDDFGDNNPDRSGNRWWTKGKRRLLNELKIERINTWHHDYVWYRQVKVYFEQRGQKKGTFGWNDYRTVYQFSEMYFRIGSEQSRYGSGDTSAEVRPSAKVTLVSYGDEVTVAPNTTPPYLSLPTVSMKCNTTFRGFDGVMDPLDHNVYSGFPGTTVWTNYDYD
ncbi:DUF4848 domain-containing protein [Sunxiuqinia rutila]|uniref:DUF4848 domain-containing protein n=1 Tax=Sunxiuqinia rutila TaxID=1397841 RepID=UPI003D35E9A9